MIRKSRLQLRPPWNLVVAMLLFVVLDAVVFKMGLSEHIASPGSEDGALTYLVRFELARVPAPGVDDALVIGASDVAYAVHPAAAAAAWPHASLRLVNGGAPGASARVEYFLVRKLDPQRERYRMVVIALPYYRAYGQEENDSNPGDIDQMATILDLRSYFDFVRSFPTTALQTNALVRGLFGSAHWAREWRTFFADPLRRLAEVHQRDRAGANFSYVANPDDPRPLETMLGLRLDPATGVLEVPPRLDERERAQLRLFMKPRPFARTMQVARENAAFNQEWLGRIVDYYRGTQTRVVFVRMPAGPIHYRRLEPPPDAPSIVEEFRHEPHVTIVDPDQFTFLEQPIYYFDPRHLNRAGSVEFSKKLLGLLVSLRGP